MRYYRAMLIVGFWMFGSGFALAQLSPGKLAQPHAGLEGLTNCTQCHTLGEHITDKKCLDCHTEIKTRIDSEVGFHTTVKDTSCVTCHSDHNGRNFDMIRWPNEDIKQFDHVRTGYMLEGKHQQAECRDCHKADRVVAPDIIEMRMQSLDRTFLGLSRDCLSCHEDEHRGQLEETCQSCHRMEAWKPAEKFDHDKSQFALVGKHQKLDCEKCHETEVVEAGIGPVEMVRFKPVAFEDCVPCHKDPHSGRFAQSCASCHSPDGWHTEKAREFDHNLTRFPLVAKHQSVTCASCHNKNTNWYRPAFSQCADCHKDVHAGQFARLSDGGACEGCHTEQGFLPAQFDLASHELTRFALRGAHEAVPCGFCHQKREDDVVQFVWKVEKFECETCHSSPHGEQFVEQIEKKGCESCHNDASWYKTDIDHDLTRFPLLGKHESVQCASCHPRVELSTGNGQLFTPIDTACQNCHQDPHDNQFGMAEKTDCAKCHTNDAWTADLFEHDRDSRFALTGSHESTLCDQCHQVVTFASGKQGRRYKPLEVACASCHGE